MTHKPRTVYGRTDTNQSNVVEALRSIGASVLILSDVGGGCPDLLVGYRGVNFLLEVKDGNKPPSARKLTEAEQAFFRDWRGTVYIIFGAADAIEVVNVMTLGRRELATAAR